MPFAHCAKGTGAGKKAQMKGIVKETIENLKVELTRAELTLAELRRMLDASQERLAPLRARISRQEAIALNLERRVRWIKARKTKRRKPERV